jgi:hypothetical protein
VLTSLERVVESEARQVTEGLFNNYKDAMNKITEPVDETAILRNHLEIKGKIEAKIDDKLRNWLEVGRTREYKARLLDTLEKDYKERTRANYTVCDKGCATEYSRLFESLYDLPEIKGTDLLADSFFKERKVDFIKRTQAFLEATKAPRKCTPLLTQISTLSKSSLGPSTTSNSSSPVPKEYCTLRSHDWGQ